jgi:uncharacterized membrane protein YfcA
MDFAIIPIVSALVAALTLVSGFGLGTILMPAFALFFPIEIAIAATGVVHFTNNLFKLALVGRYASRAVVLRFGIPAILAALAGAALLTRLAESRPLHTYTLGNLTAHITWLKLTTAALLATLAALETWPRYHNLSFPASALPVGGVLSGFVGGISGMQGALRAPFLLRAGLDRDQYVGTANVISTLVDLARLAVYAAGFAWLAHNRDYSVLSQRRTIILVAVACLAGVLGSVVGARLVKKITIRTIRALVAVLLFLSAAALGAGLI